MSSDSREHAIREMAYAMWEQAGCPAGDGVHFWLEAEKGCHPIEATDVTPDTPTPNTSASTAFRAVDPPPLKLNKTSSASRKRAG